MDKQTVSEVLGIKTLRDEFAMAALSLLHATIKQVDPDPGMSEEALDEAQRLFAKKMAEYAYVHADAMLSARTPGGQTT